MNPLFKASLGGISEVFANLFYLAILGIISGLSGSFYMLGLTGPLKIPKTNTSFLFTNYGRCNMWNCWYFLTELLGFGTNTIESLIETLVILVFSYSSDRKAFFNNSLYQIRFIWWYFFSSIIYRCMYRKYLCIFIRNFC